MWLLGAFWPLTLAHLALELVHGYQWLWIADVPLLALAGTWLWRNWPRGHVPALLRVLFLGYTWLPIALALYIAQSLVYGLDGDFIIGRPPAHALITGFFGRLVAAVVQRVTPGPSGLLGGLGGAPRFEFGV